MATLCKQCLTLALSWLLVCYVLLFPAVIVAQEARWEVPRNAFGQPNMQGVWFYGTATPFERAPELGNQANYSAHDVESLLKGLDDLERQKRARVDPSLGLPQAKAAIAQEADHNFAFARTNLINIRGEYRTSQVIVPNNGRLPYLPNGKDFFENQLALGHGAFDGPETRPVSERCAGPNAGPMAPMVSWFYNANVQIIQTKDYVVVLAEMNHDARIIPLSPQVRKMPFPQWMGHSVGHWDDDVLIVHTVGFRPEQSWFAFKLSDQLEVTEQFTLISNDEILYRYTFTDPKIYSAPVTVEKTLRRRKANEPILEYACHEGNYSLPNILAGARRLEK